jgi:hypothetical protein
VATTPKIKIVGYINGNVQRDLFAYFIEKLVFRENNPAQSTPGRTNSNTVFTCITIAIFLAAFQIVKVGIDNLSA